MMSRTATSQTCCRNFQTKGILVLSWILKHHFLHFPANDSISTSFASHSAQLSFFKHVPSSYRDGWFRSCQILPWNVLIMYVCYGGGGVNTRKHTHRIHSVNGIANEERCPWKSYVTGLAFKRRWGGTCRGYKAALRILFLFFFLTPTPQLLFFPFCLCCYHSCSKARPPHSLEDQSWLMLKGVMLASDTGCLVHRCILGFLGFLSRTSLALKVESNIKLKPPTQSQAVPNC